MRNSIKSITSIVIALLVLVVALTWQLGKAAPLSKAHHEFNPVEYTIPPKNIPDPYDDTYPTVKNEPGKWSYIKTLVKEELDYIQGRYDQLFFASKRVAEINKWWRDLEIAHSSQKKNMDLLTNIIDSEMHGKEYRSWEYELDRYENHIREYYKQIIKDPTIYRNKLYFLHQRMQKDQSTLLAVIAKSSYSQKDKDYLDNLVNLTFRDLTSSFLKDYAEYDYYQLSYPLDTIKQQREAGQYDISLRIESTASANMVMLKTKNKSYHPDVLETSFADENILLFKNIQLSLSDDTLKISLPGETSTEVQDWKLQSNKHKQSYVIQFPVNKNHTTYLIESSFKLPFEGQFIVQQTYAWKGHTKIDNIYTDNIHAQNPQSKQVVTFSPGYDELNAVITVIPKNNLLNPAATLGRIKFTPILDPAIQLAKTTDLHQQNIEVRVKKMIKGIFNVDLFNATSNDEIAYIQSQPGWIILNENTSDHNTKLTIIYLPYILSLIFALVIIFISIIAIIFLRFKHQIRAYRKNMLSIVIKESKVWLDIYRNFIYKYTKIVFLLLLILFLINTFILYKEYELLYTLTVIAWISLLYAYSAPRKYLFIAALGCLVISALFGIKGQLPISNKFAIWCYINLLLGFVYIELKPKRKSLELFSSNIIGGYLTEKLFQSLMSLKKTLTKSKHIRV